MMRPTAKPQLRIEWYKGSIIQREKGKFTFISSNTDKSVNAYKAPIYCWTERYHEFSGPASNKYWLGAYCSSAREYRLLFEAVGIIHGEIGIDPYPDYWPFPGEGFYFIGGTDRNPDGCRTSVAASNGDKHPD